MVCFGCLCFIIFVLFFSLKLSESFCFFLIRQFKRNKITVSVGKLRVSKKSVLQELAPSLLRMYISIRSLCACPSCFEFLSSKMARRRYSSIFSSDKTQSRIPTIFFSSNRRKLEYLNTVLEQSLLLTRRWHQKEWSHMNKTCTAIENASRTMLSHGLRRYRRVIPFP